MTHPTFIQAFYKSLKGFALNMPMLIGVIFLTVLFEAFITPDMLSSLFSGQAFYDTLIGTLSGAVSVAQPFIVSIK